MRRVVIVGGGYAGLHAYRQLSAAGLADVEVKLVSRDPYHTYHGWTGEVLSGRLPVEDTLSDLPGLLGDDFVHANVESIDLDAKQVHLDGAAPLDYDQLLIAAGSRDPLDALPGATEHAWRLKDTRDMQALSRRLETDPAPRRVLVIGGGPAGAEAASALAIRLPNAQIGIVSAELPFSRLEKQYPRIARHARKVLSGQGVAFHSGVRATRIETDGVHVSNGDFLGCDMVVVAAGIAFAIVPGTERLSRNEAGQIVVDASLRVSGMEDVWAAGDIAAVQRPGRQGQPCPIDALWAMKQGACAGGNIAREMRSQPLKPFGFKGMGQAAGLGTRNGISELHGLQFTGALAWLLRLGFFAWYMPYRSHGFGVMRDILLGRARRRREDPVGSTETA